MDLKIERFARNPLYVDVVVVTEENMDAVAKWCGGTVESQNGTAKFIQVAVIRPLKPRQSMAFVNDRVLKTTAGFKVYTPAAFEQSFVPAPKVDA